MSRKTKTLIIASISIVVVAALAAIAFFSFNSSKPVEKKIQESAVGNTMETIVPTDRRLVSLLAPADANWWDKIDMLATTYNLHTISWDSLPVTPKSLGYTSSVPSDGVIVAQGLGVSSVYLTYQTNEEAQTVSDWFNENTSGDYKAFSLEDTTILIPTWIYSDVEFDLSAYSKKGSEEAVSEGYLVVNFSNVGKYLKGSVESDKASLYDTLASSVGFSSDEEVVWSATSQDGLKWQGDISAGSWDISKIDVKKYVDSLATTEEFYPFDENQSNIPDPTYTEGTVPPNYPTPVKESSSVVNPDNSDKFGYILPKQSLLLEYLSIQTSKEVGGVVRSSDGAEYSEPGPLSDPNQMVVTFNPNALIQILQGKDDIRTIFRINPAVATFYSGTTRLDMDFTPVSVESLTQGLPTVQ